jgi:hypothetical protein
VVPGKPFIPEVYFDGEYYPICYHWFSKIHNVEHSNRGAIMVCEALGFAGGIASDGWGSQCGSARNVWKETSMCDETAPENTAVVFSQNAMPVGRCHAHDTSLDSCTGGENSFGDFEWENGKCKAGNEVGVYVTCAGLPPPSPLSRSLPSLSTFPPSPISVSPCVEPFSPLFLSSTCFLAFDRLYSFPAYFCVR